MSERDFYSAPELGQQGDRGQAHSTLEIGKQHVAPQSYSTLESRQPDSSLFDTYKQSTTAFPQSEIFDTSPKTPSNPESNKRTTLAGKHRGPRKRTLWVLVALGVVITITAAAIGGGVGGTSHHSISSAASGNQAPSSTTTNVSSASSSTSSIASGVAIPTTSTASSFPTPTTKLNTTLLNTTNLASLIWSINGVTQYRVWYQTEDNMIREVGKNDTGDHWFISGQSHGPAKSGSPIAASYTGPPDWQLVSALTH